MTHMEILIRNPQSKIRNFNGANFTGQLLP
jgi:hypothetical protein